MNKTLTLEVSKSRLAELRDHLHSWNLTAQPVTNEYMYARFHISGVHVQVYKSGKVVVQGDDDVERVGALISDFFSEQKGLGRLNVTEKGKKTSSTLDYAEYIGCDEAGKGESFGPLVAAACFVPPDAAKILVDAGVKDSKKIPDKKAFELLPIIEKLCVSSVVTINPADFNKQFKCTGNISEVLALAHSIAIQQTVEKLNEKDYAGIVVDKFSTLTSRLTTKIAPFLPRDKKILYFEKGEQYLPVAAASVLARVEYLKSWRAIELKYDIKLHKGYMGLTKYVADFIEKHSADELEEIAKTGFKVRR